LKDKASKASKNFTLEHCV